MLCFLRSPLPPCLCSRILVLRFSKRLCLLHAVEQHPYLCCLRRCCLLLGLAPLFPSAAFQVQCLLCLSHFFLFFFSIRPSMHFGQFAQKTSLRLTRCSVFTCWVQSSSSTITQPFSHHTSFLLALIKYTLSMIQPPSPLLLSCFV